MQTQKHEMREYPIKVLIELSKVLRHNKSIKRNSAGYVFIKDLRTFKNFVDWTIDDYKYIVENDTKNRFHLMQDKNNDWIIRANQGHSKEVGNKIDNTQIYDLITEPYDEYSCIHGTTQDALKEIIKSKKLSPMGRKHIHMASGIDAQSGMRHTADIIIIINMKEAMDYGIIFYKSANGVILTESEIPDEFFTYMTRDEFSRINKQKPLFANKDKEQITAAAHNS